jgi:hypothetical protein
MRRKNIKADAPVPRRKNQFGRTLKAAKKDLQAKAKRRFQITKELQQLNVDIPNLERTCRALEAQLGSTGIKALLEANTRPKLHLSEIGTFTKEQMNEMFPGSTGEIPPEIRAQLPPEDFSQFGSHYKDPDEGLTEEYLPPIVGKEVIPEKK